ncbi:HET-domain-containing protein, partial [Cryphonectria parasitica EP155]
SVTHCWGKSQTLCLHMENLDEFKQGIPYKSLSKTFQDAIKVTHSLDFQYLWIDSLCIIQDSQEDWLSQGAIMDEIYRNAACNISADAAQDSEDGFIRTRNIETFLPLRIDVGWTKWIDIWKSPTVYIMVHETWNTALSCALLASRAWVFQERILSQHVIHFTARQLFFETKTNTIMDWWPDMIDPSREKSWISWTKIVEEYSTKNLTFNTDKLAAMSGIVKEVHDATGDEYLAGLWRKGLLHQLLWSTSDPIKLSGSSHTQLRYGLGLRLKVLSCTHLHQKVIGSLTSRYLQSFRKLEPSRLEVKDILVLLCLVT